MLLRSSSVSFFSVCLDCRCLCRFCNYPALISDCLPCIADRMKPQNFYPFARLLKFKVETDAVRHCFSGRRVRLKNPFTLTRRHTELIPHTGAADGQHAVRNGLVASVAQLFFV